ncbi:MAG TPA: nickel-binding protein [Chitinophagaceae bacterium]|nr:nickel-binding protein [Chitinophagaceae bacterium]
MPLFMDRHDMSVPVTPEMIATIHQEDVKIQNQLGCRVLTYWFDEKRNNTFCLIEAPNAEAIHKMHALAHGQVPNTVIEVGADLVEAFLGRVTDPEKPADAAMNIIAESAFRTIMIVSFKQEIQPAEASKKIRESFQKFQADTLHLLAKHRGKLVKQNESCMMVSFESSSNAVHAAFSIKSRFSEFRDDIKNDNITLKIGLSAGVPVTGNNSFFESTIKLAERMCKIIKGDIIVSAGVKELYNNENMEVLKEEDSLLCMTEMEEKFLTSLMDFAETNWHNTDLNLDDFSKALGYSKSQLYRKMTSLTGKSPNTFIQDYRLNEALTLLNKNAGNISEIAYQTGFSSPSYFSKCFKKKYGVMPYEFKDAATR